jgi:hypothetical protein
VIEKKLKGDERAYENQQQNQDLPANGGDDSQRGAWPPGGGTDTSTFQPHTSKDACYA